MKKTLITHWPELLALGLGRFYYDRSTNRTLKHMHYVHCDLSLAVGGACYELAAVAFHTGSSAMTGHWVSVCRRTRSASTRASDSTWWPGLRESIAASPRT
eukprot:8998668-Pyramimonas_sp.AAC.1